MKTILFTIFLGIATIAFGKDNLVKKELNLKYSKKVVPVNKKKAKIQKDKTMLAYEYYYTMDWLYSETPFQHKLEAYA